MQKSLIFVETISFHTNKKGILDFEKCQLVNIIANSSFGRWLQERLNYFASCENSNDLYQHIQKEDVHRFFSIYIIKIRGNAKASLHE
jgi:hypothetical protein